MESNTDSTPVQTAESIVAPGDIQAAVAQLEAATALDADALDTETLADYAAACKALEDAAAAARKEVFEKALDPRTEVGDTVGDLTKVQGSRRYVHDDDATISAIEAAGGDPAPALSLNAKKAADLLADLGLDDADHIGTTDYTYFRRV